MNLENVWRKTRTGRKKMSQKWYIKLQQQYPHLAEVIDRVNIEDEFIPEEREQKDKNDIKKKCNSSSKKRKNKDKDHKDDNKREKPEFKRSTLIQNGVSK